MIHAITQFIFNQKPRCYGWTYLILIPIFAAIYDSIPCLTNAELNFGRALYFSTVTITTLGFGEIHPLHPIAQALTALEALLGVTLIGLFLNSLSRASSEATKRIEQELQRDNYKRKEVARLKGHWQLMDPIINKYISGVKELVGQDKKIGADQFTLNDLCKFDGLAAKYSHGLQTTKIEYYYDQLEEFTEHLSQIVRDIDLGLFPDIEKSCIEFVQATHNYDASGFLIQSRNKINKNVGDLMREALSNYNGPIEFQPNMSMIYDPMICLHKQLTQQIELLNKIGTYVEEITNINPKIS